MAGDYCVTGLSVYMEKYKKVLFLTTAITWITDA